uniref:Disease resistance RPP13-like protein 1 n=1 Tax=Fagus sylvatica TaxID=28930 RepID=A0A2N9HCY9_FAGSY
MAATLVGGAFLSATLQVLFDRMASQEVVNFIRGRKVPERLLKKLKTSFLALNAVLDDAEEKEITNTTVKEWLEELKDAVYDAEDLLDEIATEALKCMVEADFVTFTSKVRNFIPTSFNWSEQKLKSKIEEVLVRLEDLAKQKDVLGLKRRDVDKEPIVNMLLSNDAESNDHPRVIPIVGMGGVGKTTLAQLIYNDQRITEHFNLKYWVCVSQEFDIPRITKTILEDVTSDKCNTTNFNMIQTRLKESLVGKKFLLVLDDVWNEKYDDWEEFKKPFKYGALGSKIIVTTRNESVASVMCPIQIFNLNKLSEDDCWLLFANHAFENGNFNAYPHLEEIGKQIIKKCDGLPLAAKALGALLHCKLDAGEWYKVLESKIWSLPNDGGNILPALRLSYNDLPSHLKRCFAYCSTFPKDYEFKKEELVQLWMAEGFLHKQEENEEMEDIGDEYFLDLVSRSLLQQSDRNKLHFVMHDLIHDLAKFVSGRFCFSLEGENANKIIDKTRHFSYLRMKFDTSKKFEALYKAKHLRTFLPLELNRVDGDFYLTKETLNLSGCEFLDMLPSNMRKLTNLRHLDVTGTRITRMPMQMDALKAKLKAKRHLEALTLEWEDTISQRERDVLNQLEPHTNLKKLVINNYGGTSFPNWVGHCSFSNMTCLHLSYCRNCPSLPSLGQLPSLQDLCIVGFDEVVTVGLEFYGSSSSNNTPFRSLEILKFEGMLKWEEWFPHDGENEGAFQCLRELYLIDCPKLRGSLPKNVPYLTKIMISKCLQLETSLPTAAAMSYLELMYCNDLLLKELPPTLHVLIIQGFNNLESLPEEAMEHNHCLEELTICDCPMLKSLPRGDLPTSLKTLFISNCRELEFPTCYSSLESLEIIESCNSLTSFPLDIFPKLYHLKIEKCSNMESLSVLEGHHLIYLSWLEILDCPNFVAFPNGGLSAPNLLHISVSNCERLNSLPENMHTLLLSLEYLRIGNCPQVESFPEGGLPSNLIEFFIDSEKLFGTRMEWGLQRLHSLKWLGIGGAWLDVESFPEEDLFPTSLSTLVIRGFPNLRSLDLQHLPTLQQLVIMKCPELKHMPEEGLPVSISHLLIEECPLLTKRLQRKKRKEWRNIARNLTINIDGEVII